MGKLNVLGLFVLPSPDYNVEFFRNFMLVMNALDNRGIVESQCLPNETLNTDP